MTVAMYRVNGQSLCAESAVLAGLNVIDLPRANCHSNQPKSGKTDSGGHPSDLTITTFGNHNLKPRISDGFALPDGRVPLARPQEGLWVWLQQGGSGHLLVERRAERARPLQ